MIRRKPMSTRPRFADRIAVVTGAAAGIGRAIAERLHAEGATVALVDVDLGAALTAAEALGARAAAYGADIRRGDEIEHAFAEIRAELGDPHVLVNNAAYLADFGTVVETTPERWQSAIDGTLTSVYRCAREVLPAMVERRSGAIVSIASVHAFTPGPGFAAYAAAKAGVVQLTKSLALELGPYGVRANVVSPGAIDTPNNRRFTGTVEGLRAAQAKSVLGRIGDPREIAAAVAFLASDEAAFVTGANLLVDGGYLLT
jgi:NAD(P)-dependent dehydrogenase (short-subunit alcohol dehydrogenase family)